MMNQISNATGTQISGTAEQAIEAATQALESTRQLASQAMERSGEELRDRAGRLARRSAYAVSDATTAAQRQLSEYARATRRYVSREPAKSALIAAALAAAVAGIVLAVRRSRQLGD